MLSLLSSLPSSPATYLASRSLAGCEQAGAKNRRRCILLRLALHRSTKVSSSSIVAMMAMGYFRAPRRLYGRKQQQQQRESAALLVDDDDNGDERGEAAAAAGAVPKGYFAVYVGAESRRFVVPTSYLSQPAFRELMERAAEEFGFAQAGGLRIPCREEDFQATVAALEESRRRGGGRARGWSAAGPTRWARES